MTTEGEILAASDLAAGDRVDDGGSSGRIVKRVRVLSSGRVRVVWIDGWDDTYAADEVFRVRERGVVLT